MTKHDTWINNYVRVDRWARIKLANLCYDPSSSRPDDRGALYIAPVLEFRGADIPEGQLCIYATTNADAQVLGYITDGKPEWIRGDDHGNGLTDCFLDALKRADWCHPNDARGDGYSFVLEDAVNDEELAYL